MFDVEHEGSVYRYCKEKGKGYWIGVSRSRNYGRGFYPGAYCQVPIGFWPTLRKSALSQGASESIFKSEKKEKKKSVSRKKKQDENSISIF